MITPTRTLTLKIALAERHAGAPSTPEVTKSVKVKVNNLNFFYGDSQALYDISLEIPERFVVAFIGPSGCGKSTFLRTLNRMNDVLPETRVEGEVTLDG